MLTLQTWYSNLEVSFPMHSTDKHKLVVGKQLACPEVLEAHTMTAFNTQRSPGGAAYWVNQLILCGDKGAFRSLGALFLASAFQEATVSVRLHLRSSHTEIKQLVIWPSATSEFERFFGHREQISSFLYKPTLPAGMPHYITNELDNERYPKEHLPYVRPGDSEKKDAPPHPMQEICMHIQGTRLSRCWLGKVLLDFALIDNPCQTIFLHNMPHDEHLSQGSSELRFVLPGGIFPGNNQFMEQL
jgi:hypothetical protein